MIAKLLRRNETYLFFVIMAFSLVVTMINPTFLTVENMFDLVKSSSGMAILAVGFFVGLLAGGIDISFPAIAIAGQYIAVNTLIALGVDNLLLAFVLSCAVGTAMGAINAFFISAFRMPALIVTLGTSNIFHGALLVFVGTRAINTGQLPDCFKAFGHMHVLTLTRADGTTYGLSVFAVVLLGIIVVTWFLLKHTLLGKSIYAVGGSYESSKRAGFSINRTLFFVYSYIGFLSGIMGVMHLSLIRYSNPNYIVDTELLKVIAAVVIGGSKITGGSGTLVGTLLGVVMMVILEKNLVLIGLSSYWHQFFTGLIIVLGVSITHYQSKLQSKKSLSFAD
ncbi:MAG: ABC transporter permease [Desulfobacterales bacterium]|nr:MAG: ABC transporter permease [Desulfobacterales bacterium]